MAWVIFNKDFDYHPTRASTIEYKASPKRQCVKQECAEQAIARGLARRATPPRKGEAA